jgi:hypothetical protein
VDDTAPVISIFSPFAQTYLHPYKLIFYFTAVDARSGLKALGAKLDGTTVTAGQKIDLYTLSLGNHTLTVTAIDQLGNTSTKSVTFSITATVQSLVTSVNRFVAEGKIDDKGCHFHDYDYGHHDDHGGGNCIQTKLLDVLKDAQTDLNRHRTNDAIKDLKLFIDLVKSQSGRQISTSAANLLIADAQWVIAHPK